MNGAVLAAAALTSARAVFFLANRVFGRSATVQRQALIVPEQVGKSPPKEFVFACKLAKQEHLLADWDTLTSTERTDLLTEIKSLDFVRLGRAFKASTESNASASTDTLPEPIENVKMRQAITPLENIRWVNLGYSLIAQGKLAVVIMAGGQGTRLGSSAPKGCYDICLPSKKSLFQLQAEKIRRIQQLAAMAYYATKSIRNKMHVYIMTSPMTHEETRKHFESSNYFGLDPEQVHFFQQGTMPCLTSEGKLILEAPSKIARSPDGNGGLFTALLDSGCIDHMKSVGVQCVDVNCVDNALVKVADPMFNGYCWELSAECGCRTLAKGSPLEKVGVFVKAGTGIAVREYSEMPTNEMHAITETGRLKYNWSNICMHHFSVSFMQEIANAMRASDMYHVAHKKIPSRDGSVQGIKLEQFIFDHFPLARRVALLEVNRSEEFAPVKNAPNEDKPDSPETARAAVLKLHKGWIEAAGGVVKISKGSPDGLEVSPLLSYGGEGLDHLCYRKTFRSAYDVMLQGLAPMHIYKAAAAKSLQSGVDQSTNPFRAVTDLFNRTISDLIH